jgi:hypothetical protein
MPEEELPLYLHWVKFLDWLLSRTEKFPRRMRLSLSNRLENLALDFLQDLVEARYTRDKTATLRRMNLRLEQLRVLLRLCHDRRLLTPEGYEYGARMLLEAGRMVGGWIRSREPVAAPRPLPTAPGGP